MGNNQSWEPPAQEPPRPGHLQVSLSPFLDKVSDCVHVMFCSQNHNFGLSFGLFLLMPYNGYMGGKKEKTSTFDQSQRFQIRATLKLIQRNLFKIFVIFLSIKKLTHRCMSKSTHCHLSCLGPFLISLLFLPLLLFFLSFIKQWQFKPPFFFNSLPGQ